MEDKSDYIVFFDGECNFCCASVNIIISNDPKSVFKFASLQSEYAKRYILNNKLLTGLEKNKSIVLIQKGQVFIKSKAVLEISRKLRFPFPLFYIFILVPAFFRNYIYDVFSKNRYRWFGKRQSCIIPDDSIRSRFLS